MGLDLHEAERARWLLGHRTSVWRSSDQRRAARLRARADHGDRASAGADRSSRHEATIPSLPRTLIHQAQGHRWTAWLGLALLGAATVVALVAIWPALAIAAALYAVAVGLSTLLHAAPRWQSWAAATLVIGIGGGVLAANFPDSLFIRGWGPWDQTVWSWTHADHDITTVWAWLTAGLVLGTWQVIRAGWPGVHVAAPAGPSIPSIPTGTTEQVTTPSIPTAPAPDPTDEVYAPTTTPTFDDSPAAPTTPSTDEEGTTPVTPTIPTALDEGDDVTPTFDGDEPVLDNEPDAIDDDEIPQSAYTHMTGEKS